MMPEPLQLSQAPLELKLKSPASLIDDHGHAQVLDRVRLRLGVARQEVADEQAEVFVQLALASVAMVSKTMDDLPEPETPVKMVILRFGMRNETFFKLFSRAP